MNLNIPPQEYWTTALPMLGGNTSVFSFWVRATPLRKSEAWLLSGRWKEVMVLRRRWHSPKDPPLGPPRTASLLGMFCFYKGPACRKLKTGWKETVSGGSWPNCSRWIDYAPGGICGKPWHWRFLIWEGCLFRARDSSFPLWNGTRC